MSQIKTKFITNNAVTNAKAAQLPANSIKGNNTGSTANASDLTVAQVNTLLGDVLANGTVPFSADQSMGSHKLTNVTDPSGAQDAATKSYVDAAVAALNPAQSTYAATTTNLVGTYSNGAAGIGATFTVTATGAFTLDGTTPPITARILIKDQSSGFQNGIYNLTVTGGIAVSPVLTRALDYNTASDMNTGGLIPVINGTVNALTSWDQIATITTVGTDALVFSQFTANPSLYLLKANNLNDVASKSTSFNNLSPMTTGGDLIYGGASGTGTRLANGSAGQVLTSGGTTVAPTWATPTTGTVTAVSVSSANGFAGSSSGGATPALTLTTTITGVIKGNGTAISAATSGTDYSAGTSGLATGILKSTTTTGALTIAVAGDFPTLNQNTSGTAANVTGVVAIANGGTGQSTKATGFDALSPMTTKGDLVTFSTLGVRQAVGADGTFLKADSSLTNGIGWNSPNGTLSYRSVTGTDSATTADDTLVLSGVSFTETLFTAVGNTGKVIEIIHDGNSLSNQYTVATTGGQAITGGGVNTSSYVMYTNGERLKVQSTGAGWKIIAHEANTGWINLGAVTISATTTAPTKATAVNNDKLWYRRQGDSAQCRYEFQQGAGTGGATGSGDYKFDVSALGSIDTSKITANSNTEGNSAPQEPGTCAGVMVANSSTASFNGAVTVFDSTYIRFQGVASNGTVLCIGNANFPLNATNINYDATFTLPISGWNP